MFGPNSGRAQVAVPTVTPRLVRYNAALPGNPHLAETGVMGATFSIYRDQFDGAPLWSEIQNVQPDAQGGYSVLLGSTRNEGLPIELFNTAETRWLEVEVNGTKQARVQIASVPYAMMAENAQTLGGLPPSAYLRLTPESVSASSTTAKATNAANLPFRPQATAGTGGYLALFTNTTDLGNSALFQNGNTVSIGGTTSLGAITLIGNAPGTDTAGMALYNAGGGSGASVSLDMYNTSFNGGIPQAKMKALDDGNYSDNLTFLLKNPGAATNPLVERMRITSVGNVGIGTTTPGGKLEVAGNVKISGAGNGITFPDGTSITTGLPSITANTTYGHNALASNTGGDANTAVGASTLFATTLGNFNTAYGYTALYSNTIGSYNTATGGSALFYNTTGNGNTATGNSALLKNMTGIANTASGTASMSSNTVGSFNAAIGSGALGANTTGSYNTAVGYQSGNTSTAGSYNISIGNSGTSSDDHVIRIGDVQTQIYVAGITGVNVSGVPVVVSSTGQLGIASSSRRFKENIQDMGDTSERLMRLRPVTYNYKQAYEDGSKPLDYGLIAEEVDDIYPDLVAHSQDGQIETVMYQKLTPMLLNEVQRLKKQNDDQKNQLVQQRNQLTRQDEAILALSERLARLESKK